MKFSANRCLLFPTIEAQEASDGSSCLSELCTAEEFGPVQLYANAHLGGWRPDIF